MPGRRPSRDLDRTREKILAAALAEFSGKGLGGARVDAIARRARVNKRMLYYCFGAKQDLYREVMRRKLAERAGFVYSTPDDFAGALLHLYEAGGDDLDFARLLGWESIDAGAGPLIAEDERRALFEAAVARLRLGQQQGWLPDGVDLTQLLISMIALAMFPLVMPQMMRLITGMNPTQARFRRERREFLRWLGRRVGGCSAELRPLAPDRTGQRAISARKPKRPVAAKPARRSALAKSEQIN